MDPYQTWLDKQREMRESDERMTKTEIPLDKQVEIFHQKKDEALEELIGILESCVQIDPTPLYKLAESRLCQGFLLYGDTMFHWTEEKRRRNVMEELADALVYLTSAP